MKSNLALLDLKEFKKLSGILSFVAWASIAFDLKISFLAYIVLMLLLVLTNSQPVESIQEGALNSETFVLKKVYLRNSKTFQRKMYYFNRIGLMTFIAAVAVYDILVNMKVIDPI